MRDPEARFLEPAALLTRHRRARQRGAIFVEAIIVITFFVLALMGLVYFRSLYTKKLTAMRLARSAALVHSMGACKNNEPQSWIAKDMGSLNPSPSPPETENASGGSGAPQQEGKSKQVMDEAEQRGYGMSSDGTTFLNEITVATFSGEAWVAQQDATTDPSKAVFHKRVNSKSYVSCGEEVRSGNEFDGLIGWIKGIFCD
jgi:Tfp pilus assembly protein PilX